MYFKLTAIVYLSAAGFVIDVSSPTIWPNVGLRRDNFETHVTAVRKRLPGPGFTVVVQPPFVVIGDEEPPAVKKWAAGTVQWSVDELKRAYFKKDPAEIIDIWLFNGKESYERNVKKLFNETPSTPFGYYSSAHN